MRPRADRLHSAMIQLLRWLRREDVESGLTGPLLSALSLIVYGGGITIGRLARLEQVRPPSMTHIVARLEDGGYARRVINEHDGRSVRVWATHAGHELLTAGRRRRTKSLDAKLKSLTPAQLRVIDRAVTILESFTEPPLLANSQPAKAST